MNRNELNVTVYYDYICPWCYLGQIVAKRLQNEYGALLNWRPLLLHPEVPVQGRIMLPGEIESKKDMFERVTQMAKINSIPLVFPGYMIHTKRAMEASEYAREHGKLNNFHEEVFNMLYGQGKDIGNWNVLAEAAEAAGLDPKEMQLRTESGSYTKLVEDQSRNAEQNGIDSLPTYILNDSYVVIGPQPIQVFDLVLERMAKESEIL